MLERTCLVAAALSFCACALAQSPAPAPARPPHATTKVDDREGVYIFRNGNHQSMFVVTREGVIATDPVAYGRPTGGQLYLDEIRKVTDKPVKYMIYSHHHFDHVAGARRSRMPGPRSSPTGERRSGSRS
jgi:glyoxylase-like metal-dependent hydrolase (beta-lactamase superfamily II)